MNSIRRRSTKSLVFTLPLAASALLLSGCVPLDAPAPVPLPSTTAPAPAPTAQAVAWENCQDITIHAAEPVDHGLKFVSVRQERRSPDEAQTRDFTNEPFKASIDWDAHGPNSSKINDMIREAIGLRVSGSVGGFAKVSNMLSTNTENGTFVGFEAINHLTVPLTIACGKTLTATGTLNTWQGNESGILDCELGHDPDEIGATAAAAKKLYCGD